MNNKETTLKALEPYRDKTVPKDMPLPVRYDDMGYYWGKDNEMIADFDEGVNTGDGFRIRGWGRIQDEKSQDECAKYIERAINAYSQPTLNMLLIALYEVDGLWVIDGAGNLFTTNDEQSNITIPLDIPFHEVPEDHKMWEQLAELLTKE